MSKSPIKPIKVNRTDNRIVAFVAANPNTTAAEIREALSLKAGTVAPTIKALLDAQVLVVPTVKDVDEDGDTVVVPLTFPVVDADGTPVRGRPRHALKLSSKGQARAKRLLAKLAADAKVEVAA